MTTDRLTLRVAELIDDDPNLDIYRAIEIAREETEAEQAADRLARGAALLIPFIILTLVVALT